MRRTAFPLLVLALAAAGCSEAEPASSPGSTVRIALNDSSCELSTTSVPAGPVTFEVVGGGRVTEGELVQGDHVLGEKESVTPGLSRSFSLEVAEGTYAVRCPGGSGPQDQPFTVTAGAVAARGDATEQAAAAGAYAEWVRTQVAEGITRTKVLTDAVRDGDLAAAKAAYPLSRVNWERVEPVAESFGDLDPAVDARKGDVASSDAWTGYHRLEHAIYDTRSLTGMAAVADQLDKDLLRLQDLCATVTFQAADLANGASELLDEVATSKVSGEEEIYSRIDLVDFQANVDGARKAFELLRPALVKRDAGLATRISAAFTAADKGLARHRTGDGPADFETYDVVTPTEQGQLAALVDALGEPLSRVAAVLVK